MWLPLLFLAVGVGLGLLTELSIPNYYVDYLTVIILVVFDGLFGGIKAHLKNEFRSALFISGFLSNLALAILLTFIGNQLMVDLFLAAVFALGFRLFKNIAIIRRQLYANYLNKKEKNEGNKSIRVE
ncbi:small basic family protein [Amphibacillus cookii]|uniref:small basic family protein n=1 Tax=Amphibacillus cookii TaxID=767787 RepID=UPI001959E376|nr:DUF1290 domain-containing protein [Amphibacillus cookii]MBM7540483.1 small basic protein [Amphibacillus cookii]